MQDQPDRDLVRVTIEGPGMWSVVDVGAASATAEGTVVMSFIVKRLNESCSVSERTKLSYRKTDKQEEVNGWGTYGVSESSSKPVYPYIRLPKTQQQVTQLRSLEK